jgi:Uncharacterized membrane protein, putative virulence factor, COG0728
MLKLKPESIRHAIIKTSTINLLARGFGYLKHLAIAILLGFSYQTDAFFMALSLLGIFLIFVDVFDSIGVPQLVFARMKSEEEFKKLARTSPYIYHHISLFFNLYSLSGHSSTFQSSGWL